MKGLWFVLRAAWSQVLKCSFVTFCPTIPLSLPSLMGLPAAFLLLRVCLMLFPAQSLGTCRLCCWTPVPALWLTRAPSSAHQVPLPPRTTYSFPAGSRCRSDPTLISRFYNSCLFLLHSGLSKAEVASYSASHLCFYNLLQILAKKHSELGGYVQRQLCPEHHCHSLFPVHDHWPSGLGGQRASGSPKALTWVCTSAVGVGHYLSGLT